MQSINKRILMVSPSLSMQRGNGVTIARLMKGLSGNKLDFRAIELKKDDVHSLVSVVESWQPVIVHFFNANLLNDDIIAFLRNQNIPFVVTMTGTDINFLPAGQALDGFIARLAAAEKIILFNDFFMEKLKELAPQCIFKLAVIPQAVDVIDKPGLAREKLGLAGEDFVVGAIGGLRPVKDYDFLLDALIMAKNQIERLRLLVLGPWVDTAYAERIMRRFTDLDWVIYRTNVFHDDVASYMKICDVVVNTSLAEGQPQAALEAVSVGVPALLRSVPGNRGVLADQLDACLFDSSEGLSLQLVRLAENPLEISALRKKYQSFYSAGEEKKKELDSYRNIYMALLEIV